MGGLWVGEERNRNSAGYIDLRFSPGDQLTQAGAKVVAVNVTLRENIQR
jgi:hypothetical protein